MSDHFEIDSDRDKEEKGTIASASSPQTRLEATQDNVRTLRHTCDLFADSHNVSLEAANVAGSRPYLQSHASHGDDDGLSDSLTESSEVFSVARSRSVSDPVDIPKGRSRNASSQSADSLSKSVDKLICENRRQFYSTSDIDEDDLYRMRRDPNGYQPIFDMLRDRLSNLTLLSLSHLDLLDLPESIYFPPSLEILYLTGNLLTALPEVLRKLGKLKILHLGSNHFYTIPGDVGYLISLETLDMTNNRLTEKRINDETMRVSPNKGVDLAHVCCITTICLASNQLEVIPSSIMAAISLRQLDLSYNKINVIPECISSLKELRFLVLKSNRLRRIGRELAGLDNVQMLCFSENTITQVDMESIRCIKNVRTLCLHSNRIPANVVSNLRDMASERHIDIRLAENCTDTSRKDFQEQLRKCLNMDKPTYEWDVFITSTDEDEDLVENQILPKVEEEWGFKACTNYRDYIPGMGKLADINIRMEKSKCMLIIITSDTEVKKIPGALEATEMYSDAQTTGGGGHHFLRQTPKIIPVLWNKETKEPMEFKTLTFVQRKTTHQEKYFWDQIHKSIKQSLYLIY